MLIDFSFSNYKSFLEEQSFTMSGSRKSDVSTVAAIYGANAGGKTNFLQALSFMSSLVRAGFRSEAQAEGLQYHPFALNRVSAVDSKSSEDPSTFLVEFTAEGQKYRYWFSQNSSEILEENLVVYRKLKSGVSTHPSLLFNRERGKAFQFGTLFKGPKRQLEQVVRPNTLVLSAAATMGIQAVQPAYDFFVKQISFNDATAFDVELRAITDHLEKDPEFAANLSSLVAYADFGIDGLSVASSQVSDSVRKQLKIMTQGLIKDSPGQRIKINFPDLEKHLVFQHKGEIDGEPALADLAVTEESRGTLAALSFFSLALRALSHPTVLLTDEIDSSLHPVLVREFIRLFRDKTTNPFGSQLIFTTHDVTLLSKGDEPDRVLDRDEVWFAEKNRQGCSEIYPLTDLGVRTSENYGRNYLEGVYGATPHPNFHTAFTHIADQWD